MRGQVANYTLIVDVGLRLGSALGDGSRMTYSGDLRSLVNLNASLTGEAFIGARQVFRSFLWVAKWKSNRTGGFEAIRLPEE
jgi:hypothetical protein